MLNFKIFPYYFLSSILSVSTAFYYLFILQPHFQKIHTLKLEYRLKQKIKTQHSTHKKDLDHTVDVAKTITLEETRKHLRIIKLSVNSEKHLTFTLASTFAASLHLLDRLSPTLMTQCTKLTLFSSPTENLIITQLTCGLF